MKINAAVLLTCALALPLNVNAQNQNIVEACRTIITDGLREYSIQTSSSEYLNTIYDKYCESSGSVKSNKLGLGIDLVLDEIPVGLKGDLASSQQQITNFCRNYKSTNRASSAVSSTVVTTVSRAYQSFDQCIAMAQQFVVMNHKVVSPDSFNFQIAPGFSRPIKIKGVQIIGDVVCSGQTGPSSTLVEFKPDTSLLLANNDTLSLGCKRTPKKDGQQNLIYDTATVTIFTDLIPNGNYSVYLPKQTFVASDDAAEISRRLNNLQNLQNKTNVDLQKVDESVRNMSFMFMYTDRGRFPLPEAPKCLEGYRDTGASTTYSVEGGPQGIGQNARLCVKVP